MKKVVRSIDEGEILYVHEGADSPECSHDCRQMLPTRLVP
jgi:hypothetical protein